MITNTLKEKIRNGRPLLGVLSPTADGILCEYTGLAGLDFYMIDAEHGPIDPFIALQMVRACQTVKLPCLARIGSIDKKVILQYLDAGIEGVMIPGLTSAEGVANMVQAVRYPPLGKRGLGPVRSASYLMAGQSQWDYVQYANENVLLLPQIEDIAIVDELDEIVKMDGVDGFVIGPRDLAMSMGFYDGPAHKEAQQMVNHIIKTVVHSGKLCGTVASTAEQAQSLIDQGVKIIINSVQTIYISGIKNFIQSIKYK